MNKRVNRSTEMRVLDHLRSKWHMQCESQLTCDYPCPFCDAEFAVGAELKSHIESQHQVIHSLYLQTTYVNRSRLTGVTVALIVSKSSINVTPFKIISFPNTGRRMRYF